MRNRHTLLIFCCILGFIIIGALFYQIENKCMQQIESSTHNLKSCNNKRIETYNKYYNCSNKNYENIKNITFLTATLQDKTSRINKLLLKINNQETTNNNLYKKIKTLTPYRNMSVFKQILNNIATAHEYELDKYDCTEFSNDLSKKLNKYGWDTKPKMVISDCDSGLFNKSTCEIYDGRHMIVHVKNIYIEATTDNIILPEIYKEYGIK